MKPDGERRGSNGATEVEISATTHANYTAPPTSRVQTSRSLPWKRSVANPPIMSGGGGGQLSDARHARRGLLNCPGGRNRRLRRPRHPTCSSSSSSPLASTMTYARARPPAMIRFDAGMQFHCNYYANISLAEITTLSLKSSRQHMRPTKS